MHHRVLPLPGKLPTILANIHARAVDLVTTPLAMVLATIGPIIDSRSFFFALLKFAFIVRAFNPSFNAMAFLEVVNLRRTNFINFESFKTAFLSNDKF